MTEQELIAEARRAYRRAYYKKNKKKIAEYNKRYRQENPDKVKEINQNYWLRKAQEKQKKAK